MINHISINVRSYAKARDLYEKMLAPLGYTVLMDLAEYETAGFGSEKPDLWLSQKEGSTEGTHVAFEAKNKEQVEAFYKAALEAGATDNGAPGYRKDYAPGYYAAFVHDYDKNNIEAVFMDPSVTG